MIDPNQMASGGGLPPQPGGGVPPPQEQPRIAPGAPPQGGPDPQAIQEALVTALQQSVDQQGFVDMNKFIQIWSQVAQQVGLDIPFEAILAMIDQNPEILEGLISQLGLAGMIIDGQKVTGAMLEQAIQQSGGGGAAPAGAVPGGAGEASALAQGGA